MENDQNLDNFLYFFFLNPFVLPRKLERLLIVYAIEFLNELVNLKGQNREKAL